jgi:hypothetical protein
MDKEVIINQTLKNNRPSKINTFSSPQSSTFSPNKHFSTPPPKSSYGTYYWKYFSSKRESNKLKRILESRDKKFNKILKNIDCKMSRIELYFQEIDRRIKSGIPFTPPTSSSSRSNSLSNSESDKLSLNGDDKSSLSPTVLNNEKIWKEVK